MLGKGQVQGGSFDHMQEGVISPSPASSIIGPGLLFLLDKMEMGHGLLGPSRCELLLGELGNH